jgi:RNA recognition motif-containing protein
MSDIKKRKMEDEENDNAISLRRTQALSYLEVPPLPYEQLQTILLDIVSKNAEAYTMLENIIAKDVIHRRIFIRGLGPEPDSKTYHDYFSEFGEIEDFSIISDRATGNSKGFGFILYKLISSTNLCLQVPEKIINGKKINCNLAALKSKEAAQVSASSINTSTNSMLPQPPSLQIDDNMDKKKLFIRNLDVSTTAASLRAHFNRFGEIEECNIIKDKISGLSKLYGFIVFKHLGSTASAMTQPIRDIDGSKTVSTYAKKTDSGHGNNNKSIASNQQNFQQQSSLAVPFQTQLQPLYSYSKLQNPPQVQQQQPTNPYLQQPAMAAPTHPPPQPVSSQYQPQQQLQQQLHQQQQQPSNVQYPYLVSAPQPPNLGLQHPSYRR